MDEVPCTCYITAGGVVLGNCHMDDEPFVAPSPESREQVSEATGHLRLRVCECGSAWVPDSSEDDKCAYGHQQRTAKLIEFVPKTELDEARAALKREHLRQMREVITDTLAGLENRGPSDAARYLAARLAALSQPSEGE